MCKKYYCHLLTATLKVLILLLIFLLNNSSIFAQKKYPKFYDEIDRKLSADSTAKIFISSIQVTGNKRTKYYIIQREMRIQPGDSILASALFEKLKRSQELIYNTSLFTEVILEPEFISATDMSIKVSVKEKWYIYPSPQFQLVDRNFNEWINTYHADLNRVIYGAKFAHYNLSGRRDQLRIYLLTGYARNFSFSYSAPYSNKKLTEGFFAGASYTQNREVSYKTNSKNFLLRFSNEAFVRKTLGVSGSYIVRKGFYRRHIFSLGYSNSTVVDSLVTKYNPLYFGNKKNNIGYTDASYIYAYVHTNNVK